MPKTMTQAASILKLLDFSKINVSTIAWDKKNGWVAIPKHIIIFFAFVFAFFCFFLIEVWIGGCFFFACFLLFSNWGLDWVLLFFWISFRFFYLFKIL
jgi:hypothetical protein